MRQNSFPQILCYRDQKFGILMYFVELVIIIIHNISNFIELKDIINVICNVHY